LESNLEENKHAECNELENM